jgi:hypothetical protein
VSDSFHRHAGAFNEQSFAHLQHSFAPPLASLAELSDDDSESSVGHSVCKTNELKANKQLSDDELDRIFENVFETFIEEEEEEEETEEEEEKEEEEVDSDDQRMYYDSLQSAVKSRKSNENSFMPRDLSLLTHSSASTGPPHSYQVPTPALAATKRNQYNNHNNIRSNHNLSLTQYGSEVVAEEVLRQLLLNEQLADSM